VFPYRTGALPKRRKTFHSKVLFPATKAASA
jgi:hypothetical protein